MHIGKREFNLFQLSIINQRVLTVRNIQNQIINIANNLVYRNFYLFVFFFGVLLIAEEV